MEKYIKYYYGIDVEKYNKINNDYYFYYNNELYVLKKQELNIDNKKIIELNNKLNNTLFNKIIYTKNNDIAINIENSLYILYKIYINLNKKISLSEINSINNINLHVKNNEINWYNLWTNKIDNLEYQISQNGKKHPILVDSFSYFIGLSENAISYLNNSIKETKKEISDNLVLSHYRIKDIFSLYDIVNLVFDHKSRDISEYIKLSFFNNNQNIFKELDEYFNNNYYSEYGIRLLYSRILFPSFFFDIYDDITIDQDDEKKILNIIKRIDEYEIYLKDIHSYLTKFYNIPSIDWLKKRINH